MKKETLAEKLARKAFNNNAVQKSWQAHTQVFGPILEPAFIENYQARIDLTAALNYISNRELQKGFKKLQSIQKSCSTDEDKAAWLFCMGLCFEMANMKDEMLEYYQGAGKYGHSFYLPYIKIAKTAHNDAVFEVAEANYKKAIQCLMEDETVKQKRDILGAAYTNYASCLTMMHRYEDAEEALEKSIEILPEQKGRAATEAILAAAKGDAEKAHYYTEIVEAESPDSYEMTKNTVCSILENRHPQFSRIALECCAIDSFWNWFVSNESVLLEKLAAEEYSTVFQMIQPQLKAVFPFMERELEFGIEPKGNTCLITFADFFMASLEHGYEELVNAVPESLMNHWDFDTTH